MDKGGYEHPFFLVIPLSGKNREFTLRRGKKRKRRFPFHAVRLGTIDARSKLRPPPLLPLPPPLLPLPLLLLLLLEEAFHRGERG